MDKPNLTRADFEWKLAQLRAYCNHIELHAAVGPALELGTCVAGRLLLEFLGIKCTSKKKPYSLYNPDSQEQFDVTVRNYGLEPYPYKVHLSADEQGVLINFILRAHRISHFTRDDEPDRHEWTCKGASLIERIFNDYFYNEKRSELR